MRRLLRFLAWSAVPAAAVVLLVAVPAPARPPAGLAKLIDDVITGPDYTHASWGVLVVDAEGKPVYERNPDQMLAPASVTKLFSCAAALRRPRRRTTSSRRPCTAAGSLLNGTSAAT